MLFCFCSFNANCTTKKEPLNVFENIEKYRTVWTGNDSIQLNPFEILVQLKFKDYEFGGLNDREYLKFESQDSLADYNSIILFEEETITKKMDFKNGKWIGKSLILRLTSSKDIHRELIKNKTYNAILAYKSDNTIARSNEPTDAFLLGYYIVDIVVPGHKFQRQIPFNYDN